MALSGRLLTTTDDRLTGRVFWLLPDRSRPMASRSLLHKGQRL